MFKKDNILTELFNLKVAHLELSKEYGIIKDELKELKNQIQEYEKSKTTMTDTIDQMLKDHERYTKERAKLNLISEKHEVYNDIELEVSDLSGSL